MLLLNPTSGSGRRVEQVRALAADRRGLVLRESRNGSDLARRVEDAVQQGISTIIAAGGDGTVHAVVNALAPHFNRVTLGVIPAGSANDFARTMQLSNDLDEAMRVIESGHAVHVDVVRAHTAGGRTRYWLNAATGGFSSLMGQQLDDQTKARFGAWAYVVAALKALPQSTVYRVTLSLDGRPIKVNASAVVLANGRSAGGVELVPDADPSDGLLDVLIVTAQTAAEIADVLADFTVNRHLDSDLVIRSRARQVEVSAQPQLMFRVDGEPLPAGPMRFEVMPGALRMLAPAA